MKEEILNRALDRIAEGGLNRLGVDDITREVGVSRRTLYRSFPTRDRLIEAIMERLMSRVEKKVGGIIADRSRPPLERLYEVVQFISRMASRPARSFLLALERNRPDLFAKLRRFRHERVRGLEALLREAQETGQLRADLDTRLAIEILFSAVDRIIDPEFLLENELAASETLLGILNLFLYGVVETDQQDGIHRAHGRVGGRAKYGS